MPETIGEARERLSQEDAAISREEGGDGYKYSETLSVHGRPGGNRCYGVLLDSFSGTPATARWKGR